MKMKKLKLPKPFIVLLQILRGLILSLALALIGIDLYVVQSTVFLRDAMPMPFGYGASIVLSGSMEPTLSAGDLIIVHEEPSYAIGDQIVFRDRNSFTVHRLKFIDGETFVTRGDANGADDAPISLKDVKGKVVKCLKGAGNIVSAIRSPIGILITLGIIMLLFEAPYLMSDRKKKNELDAIRAEIEQLKRNK